MTTDETLLPLLHAHKVSFGLAKKPTVRRLGPYLVLALPFIYLIMAGYMMYSASKGPASKGKPVGKRQDRNVDQKGSSSFAFLCVHFPFASFSFSLVFYSGQDVRRRGGCRRREGGVAG